MRGNLHIVCFDIGATVERAISNISFPIGSSAETIILKILAEV
jgi:hypothetical protein